MDVMLVLMFPKIVDCAASLPSIMWHTASGHFNPTFPPFFFLSIFVLGAQYAAGGGGAVLMTETHKVLKIVGSQ